jgi:hypothetical protein
MVFKGLNFGYRTWFTKYAYFFYLCIFLVLAFPKGFDTIIIATEKKALTVLATNQEIQSVFGVRDIATYARGGEHLVENNFSFKDKFYIDRWAPGMFWLHAVFLSGGDTVPIVLMMMLVSILLWSLVLAKLCSLLSNRLNMGIGLAFFFPLSILLVPHFLIITLSYAVLGSGSYSIVSFILGFLYFLESYFVKKSKKLLIISGLFFAIAAYFSARFDLFMRVYGCLLFVAFLGRYFYSYIKMRFGKNHKETIKNEYSIFLKRSLLVFAVFFVMTLPWRIYHSSNWVKGKGAYTYLWMDDEQLGGSDSFLVRGGINAAACKIKPDLCSDFRADDLMQNGWKPAWRKSYVAACQFSPDLCLEIPEIDLMSINLKQEWLAILMEETFKTIIYNPLEWSYYKFPFLVKFWFQEGGDIASIALILINSILLCFMLAVVIIAIINRTIIDMLCCLVILIMLTGTIIPSFVFHFETRYLYPIKIFSYFAFMISLANFLYNRKQNS